MGNAKRKTLTLESLKKLHPCNFLKIEFLHSTSDKNKGPNRSYGKDLLSVPRETMRRVVQSQITPEGERAPFYHSARPL